MQNNEPSRPIQTTGYEVPAQAGKKIQTMTLSIEEIRDYCLQKKGPVTEEFPFGEDVLVFKICGKIFLLTRIEEHPLSINLKCEPEHAIELRERYEAVQAGYHMHKRNWNTVTIDGSIPADEVLKMIDHSYDQVVQGLPLKLRRSTSALQ